MKKFFSALVAILACICITACTPADVDKAETKMEDAGYTVIAYSNDDAEGLIGGIIATKGLIGGESVTALYFETADDAKSFFEDVNESNAKQDGKWVYWGTEGGISAFTK